MASRDRISLAVVTFNEEHNIAECLESARWMDEIIVVDSFSTDRTLELCRRYTDKIWQRPFAGYGSQKNFAIDQTSMDWVFVLDADERIPESLRWEMEAVLQSPAETLLAYRVARKNYFYGHWLRWGGQYPDWQVRLFRKGTGYNDDFEPHHGFIHQGKLATLEHPLIHYTERKISDHYPKANLQTSLAAEYRVRTCKKVHRYDLLFRPMATFFQTYIRKRGYRDGIPGLIQATFKSLYTFGKYAKVWEILEERELAGHAHRD